MRGASTRSASAISLGLLTCVFHDWFTLKIRHSCADLLNRLRTRRRSFADFAQNLGGMLAETRRRPGCCHGLSVANDRGAHTRNAPGLGRLARRIDAHSAMPHLRVGKNLVERIDRPGG